MRVRGFEFEAKGNITREMEIVAGYSLLDPKVTASVLPANVGKDMMNTARQQASLWGKYTFFDGPVAGLGLGAGVRYVGETYGDAANTLQVPSYTLFDAAVSYDFGYMQPNLRPHGADQCQKSDGSLLRCVVLHGAGLLHARHRPHRDRHTQIQLELTRLPLEEMCEVKLQFRF